MSNKYYNRSSFTVSRDNDDVIPSSKQSDWMTDFANALEKSAVKSKREDYALFDQITNILGNKSKYSTVDEAVEDLKKRTGLSAYLDQIKSASVAADQIQAFKDVPELKTFIDNYVSDKPGTTPEAVVHNALNIKSIKEKLPHGDDVSDDVKKYINNKLIEMKQQDGTNNSEDMHLGKSDMSVNDSLAKDDPFSLCEPARKTARMKIGR